jgi:hypothetical protein
MNLSELYTLVHNQVIKMYTKKLILLITKQTKKLILINYYI